MNLSKLLFEFLIYVFLLHWMTFFFIKKKQFLFKSTFFFLQDLIGLNDEITKSGSPSVTIANPRGENLTLAATIR